LSARIISKQIFSFARVTSVIGHTSLGDSMDGMPYITCVARSVPTPS
jgi:hypothetical protein